MSQTTTQKLGLTKDDGNEAFLDLRPHVNANMETIDDFAGDISDSIADFETNPATSNHSAGTYFMLENTLHRAKTAIASGESITSSNAEPITIAEVLNTLNGNVSALQDSVSKIEIQVTTLEDGTAKIDNLQQVECDVIACSTVGTPSSIMNVFVYGGYWYIKASQNNKTLTLQVVVLWRV